MLVSGGKVIAIDSIKKGNTNKDTLSGDGVWTNLGVNTDVIATTKKLNDTKSELESKINSASSVLSGEIKKKQDELKFELNKFDKITAIGPKNGTTTALAGGSNVVVSAGANTRVVTSSAGEQTIYTVNVTANPTNVSGENGLTARRDNNTSAYYLGLNNNYIQAITSVSSKLPITAFTSYSAAHKNDDVTPYTAGNYIEITNHKIIGHDWTNTIKSASSNAVTTVRNTFNGNGTSYSGYNGKPFIDNTTPKWSVVGDGNRISVTSANNKYGVSWDGRGIATEEWVLGKNYLPKDVASSTYLTIASANEIYQKKLNAGAGIVIKNETDISVDISVSGDIIPYSAGEGIGIDNHIVSITADYLSANALKDLSGRWESAANALEASADNWNKTYKDVSDSANYWNSAYDALASADKWNTTYERVELSGDEWDKVTDKLDSATFATYSADIKTTIETFSGEFVELSGDFTAHSADSNLHLSAGEREKWTDAANRVENSAAIWDTVSAKVNKTEFEEFKTSAHNELEKKLDKVSFESWSANKDYDFYSAGNGIKIENHIVSVSADYALSADVDNRLTNYYDKDEVDEKFADFGGFVVVTTLPVSGDNKKIYLINDPTSPNPDQYKEYIYTENVWKCIGDTSVDLTQYYKKTETSGAEEISAAIAAIPGGDAEVNNVVHNNSGSWNNITGLNGIKNYDLVKLMKYSPTGDTLLGQISPVDSADNLTFLLHDNLSGVARHGAVELTITGVPTFDDMTAYQPVSSMTAYYPMTGNPSGFLTAHQSLTGYYLKTETSSHEEISAAINELSGKLPDIESVYTLTGGTGVEIETDHVNQKTIINVTGQFDNTAVNNVVQNYSANGTWLTAHQSLSNYYTKTDTSSKQEIDTALQYISSNAGKTYTGDEPIYVNNETNHIGITGESLSAGPNIDIFASGGYVVISANGSGQGSNCFPMTGTDGTTNYTANANFSSFTLTTGQGPTGANVKQTVHGVQYEAYPATDVSASWYNIINATNNRSNCYCIRFTNDMTSASLEDYSAYDKVTVVHSNEYTPDCMLYWDGNTKVFPSGLYYELVKGTNNQNQTDWFFTTSGWINNVDWG